MSPAPHGPDKTGPGPGSGGLGGSGSGAGRDPRDEAERLVAAALATVSVAVTNAVNNAVHHAEERSGTRQGGQSGQSGHGFATGAGECCVCPVCRAVSVVRAPDPVFVERLATGVGDLATGLAGLLRAFGNPPPTRAGGNRAAGEGLDPTCAGGDRAAGEGPDPTRAGGDRAAGEGLDPTRAGERRDAGQGAESGGTGEKEDPDPVAENDVWHRVTQGSVGSVTDPTEVAKPAATRPMAKKAVRKVVPAVEPEA